MTRKEFINLIKCTNTANFIFNGKTLEIFPLHQEQNNTAHIQHFTKGLSLHYKNKRKQSARIGNRKSQNGYYS